jgi:nucleoside-triphosphatase THEP1
MIERYAGQILLVTGPRSAGKTTLCRRVVDLARQASWEVSGIISPAIIKGGFKVGIGAMDLRSGKRYLLARLPGEDDEPQTQGMRWIFDGRCLQWCNQVLKQAVPTDLLVVDEIGSMELERGQGMLSGLDAIDSRFYHLAVVVVRQELLRKLRWRWPRAGVMTVENVHQLDGLMDRMIEKIVSIQGLVPDDFG